MFDFFDKAEKSFNKQILRLTRIKAADFSAEFASQFSDTTTAAAVLHFLEISFDLQKSGLIF